MQTQATSRSQSTQKQSSSRKGASTISAAAHASCHACVDEDLSIYRPFQYLYCKSYLSGLQKGPAERGHVKKRQRSSKIFATLFDSFRAEQKVSKIVQKCQKYFRHFSTIFVRHQFSGPFWEALSTYQFVIVSS